MSCMHEDDFRTCKDIHVIEYIRFPFCFHLDFRSAIIICFEFPNVNDSSRIISLTTCICFSSIWIYSVFEFLKLMLLSFTCFARLKLH